MPVSAEKHGQQQPDRKSQIVAETINLAFEHGPDEVSTLRIAKRLNITQPALYKHFASKDAIWAEVAAVLARRIETNIETCLASRQPAEVRLRSLVLWHIEFLHEFPALPDIMMMRRTSTSFLPVRDHLQSEMGKLQKLIVALVSEAQSNGVLRADIAASDAATLFLGMVQSLVLRMIVSRDPACLLRDGARLFDLQMTTLAPREDKP